MLNRPLILLLLFTITTQVTICQEALVQPRDKNPFGEDGIYISLQAGTNFDHLRPSGYQVDYLKFNRPVQPYLSALVDFEIDEMSGFIFRLEMGYKKIHFRAKGYPNKEDVDEYELKGHSLIPVVSGLYRVPWRWKLRPYGGFGIAFVVSSFKKNTMTTSYKLSSTRNQTDVYDDYYDLDGDQYGLQYTVGFMCGKRWDFSCKLLWTKLNRDDDPQHNFRNRPVFLSCGYRL